MVVNGAYRGYRAILKSLDTKNFCVTIVVDSVSLSNISARDVNYKSFCISAGTSKRTSCRRCSI